MRKEKQVMIGWLTGALLLTGVGWAGFSYLSPKQEVATAHEPTEAEVRDMFQQKEPVDDTVLGVGEDLLTYIQATQPAFNAEGHGYFRVQGDSMTPNFYEGDTVKLMSPDYAEGDFVALTIRDTGEHLIKQWTDGELVSSNASGAYYKRDDVVIHGKVERVQEVAMEVKQTLQAATGIYVVDISLVRYADGAEGAIYVLLSNGQVYARYISDTTNIDDDNAAIGGWTKNDRYANWYLSGTSFPLGAGVTPISIHATHFALDTMGSVYVLLSDGQVYARFVYDTINVFNETPLYGGWGRTTSEAAWRKSSTSIPVSLVNAPNGGGSLAVPANRLVGRTSTGTGDAEFLSANQTKQLLESTSFLYYPVGTTASSVGMVEVRSIDNVTKVWRSNKGGIEIYHTVNLFQLPVSTGDLRIQ